MFIFSLKGSFQKGPQFGFEIHITTIKWTFEVRTVKIGSKVKAGKRSEGNLFSSDAAHPQPMLRVGCYVT